MEIHKHVKVATELKNVADRARLRATACWMLMLLAGCSGMPFGPAPEELVAERAMAHARALQAGDYERALAYTTPGFRASARAQRYPAIYSGATKWEKVDLRWVKCEDSDTGSIEACKARVAVYPLIPGVLEGIPVNVDATWLLIDGEWYRFED